MAKINTYASIGETSEKRLKNGGKKFEYMKDDFYYRDIYFGFNPFIGEEVIFYQKKPIWGMNYYGKVISELVTPKEIYSFLKEALKRVPKNKPYRGPADFNNSDFKYTNNNDGTIEKFCGEEKIFYKNRFVYKLNYYGGFIKNNQELMINN